MLWIVRSLMFSLLKQFIRHEFPTVQQMTTAVFLQKITDTTRPQPLILDSRTEEEFAVSHIAGATRILDGEDEAIVLKNISKSTPIVAYCSVGYRSSKLAQKLMGEGFQEVFNLEGGIFQWANEGHLTQQVHPYNKSWGIFLKQQQMLEKDGDRA
jgi:rhodanese-related sulfurtransferase